MRSLAAARQMPWAKMVGGRMIGVLKIHGHHRAKAIRAKEAKKVTAQGIPGAEMIISMSVASNNVGR